MPKVSVIIPAYNASKYLRETLDSVFGQTYRDFEVIAVDDGSTDETVNILKSYGDRVRWAAQQHQGQAYALNRGIGMAAGEYVTYLDADDLMLPTRLEAQVGYLDEHPEVDLTYSDVDEFTPELHSVSVNCPAFDPFLLLQRDYICRSTVMHRRDCLNRVGLFNGQLTGSDDWDMWVRMSEACRLVHIDQAILKFRIHSGSTSSTRRRRLNHVRWARWMILKSAWIRRGKPFWLRIMVLSAWAYWLLGNTPVVGERFPRAWSLMDRLQRSVERLLLGWMAEPPQPAQSRKSSARQSQRPSIG